MITNEERHDVAARLRKEAERHTVGFDPLKLMEYIGIDVNNEPFFDGWHQYPELITFETWNRLADLIEHESERTCRMEHREGKDKPFCSNCGEEMDAYTCEWTEPMEYSYPFCYACGAKVRD